MMRHNFILVSIVVLLVAGSTALAVCVTGDAPHVLRFRAVATGDLDALVFWDPAPEMFMRVYLEGVEICNIDGFDGWMFDGECAFDVPEPYDPVTIKLELMDEDFPLDDYTVDINPTGNKTLEFTYDPQCGTVAEILPGEMPGCPAGNSDPACRGTYTTTGGEGYVQFEITPADGVPLIENSLSIGNMETIQVVPNPSRIVADRPTVVRLDVGSSHPVGKLAAVTVTARDKNGNTFVDVQDVFVPACGQVEEATFFGPGWNGPGSEAGFRPENGPLNLFSVEAEIDPAEDCDGADPPCQPPLDCRIVDGQIHETELELVQARVLEVKYMPFFRRATPVCHDDVELEMPPIADRAARPLLEDIYPINTYSGLTSTSRAGWPLPAGEPLIDFADLFDPRPGLVVMELPTALAGIDRLVLVTYPGGLECMFPSLDVAGAPGAAAGELSRVSLAEPRRDNLDYGENVVHEISHTFGLSDAACPISGDLFGGIKCEDEYNFPAEYTVPGNGVESFGVQVLRWVDGETATDRDMDGRPCVMGSGTPGEPRDWIDFADYETLLDELTSTAGPEPAFFVRVRLTPDFGGTFLRDDASRLTAVPTRPFDATTGRDPSAYSTTLRVLRSDGSFLGSTSFTLETVDLDGDGVVEGYAGSHGIGTLDFLDAAVILPLPPDAARIELVKRSPGPVETVTDTLELASPPILLELLEPRSSFFARIGERYEFRWRALPGFPLSGAEEGTGPATDDPAISNRAYVFLSPDNGANWWPVGAYLDGESFEFTANEDRRYLVRVFATTGFETSDVQGEKDDDADGCGTSTDPDPKVPDPDGPDQDGVAQVCDVCPNVYDPLQGDIDEDVVGNACDNCVDVFNPQQANQDQDPLGDLCDCSPGDPGIWITPPVVTGLRVAKSAQGVDYTDLSWDSLAETSGPSTVYDAVSGDVATLATESRFDDATCVAVDVQQDTATVYKPAPAPGEAHWFLIRGDSPCGAGSYDSGGAGQFEGRDPRIQQSQGPCA